MRQEEKKEQTMQAAVLYAPGDLRVEQVAIPEPQPGWVRIRVRATGICGSDLERILVTGTYHFPTIPGHEFCGEVDALGEGVSGWTKGDRVLVAPIIPCRTCDACSEGNYGQCRDYDYIGSRRDGAFAEYVTAPAENLLALPDSISYAEGGAVEPACVSLHGVNRLSVCAGDTVVVLGCGPIGLFAMQFAKIMGAKEIIAVDIEEAKLEWAKEAGATRLIHSGKEDVEEVVRQQTDGRGADITIETAGISATQVQAVSLCRNHGQVLYLGTAHKDVVFPPAVFERIIRGEIRVTGSWNSFSAPFPGREWHAVLSYLADGRFRIAPFLSHTIRLDELPEMIRRMQSKELLYCKVVVTF